MKAPSLTILEGDCISQLKTLPDESVHCCVTSPPYWGLRDYGVEGQIGLEKTPEEYVAKMVTVFQEVRRVLRNDGTCWVNLGDSYNTGTTKGSKPSKDTDVGYWQNADKLGRPRVDWPGLKPKDLCGIPWRVAFALQADGWWLRQDIIWAKPNPMPESVQDRCCKSHEYLFLLSKSPIYYFDNEAIKEPSSSMGSEIQPVAQGQSGGAEVLLFSEGTGDEEGVSSEVRFDSRTEGALQVGGKASRKGVSVQSETKALRLEPEGENSESEQGQKMGEDGTRSILQTQNRDQTKAPDQKRGLHSDVGTMASNQGGVQKPVCLLPPNISTAREGSCDSTGERRDSHGEEHCASLPDVQRQKRSKNIVGNMSERGGTRTTEGLNLKTREEKTGDFRTKRSVWTIPSQAYSEAHFATFPEALVKPCILAGTSARGCCPKCGAPWGRVVEIGELVSSGPNKMALKPRSQNRNPNSSPLESRPKDEYGDLPKREIKTTGWTSTCDCGCTDTAPCTVLDPFGGSFTSCQVALELGRNAVGIELNPEYVKLARARCAVTPGLSLA